MATGTVTITEQKYTSVKKIKFVFVSTAGGAASDVTTKVYDGEVLKFVAVPDGGGTQPTDAWDVTITDADSIDVLDGAGANLSNASTTQVGGLLGNFTCIANSALTLNVTNLGAAKGATVYLYLR